MLEYHALQQSHACQNTMLLRNHMHARIPHSSAMARMCLAITHVPERHAPWQLHITQNSGNHTNTKISGSLAIAYMLNYYAPHLPSEPLMKPDQKGEKCEHSNRTWRMKFSMFSGACKVPFPQKWTVTSKCSIKTQETANILGCFGFGFSGLLYPWKAMHSGHKVITAESPYHYHL